MTSFKAMAADEKSFPYSMFVCLIREVSRVANMVKKIPVSLSSFSSRCLLSMYIHLQYTTELSIPNYDE